MVDIFGKVKRSIIMSRISGRETTQEILVRKHLFCKGFRYRKNVKILPGKPDIVLSKYNAIIFVNGCFWHGHKKCKAAKLPDTRHKFWANKISENIKRDKRNIKKLRKLGWRVFIVWTCEVLSKEKRDRRLRKLYNDIIK